MNKDKKIIKMLKAIEPYYVLLSYGFIAFFFAITGSVIMPILIESSGEKSYEPIFYALTIIFGWVYFGYYKVVKKVVGDKK